MSGIVERLRSAGCVFAEDEAALILEAATTAGDVDELVRRRVKGEPLEHVLGWATFCGLRVHVDQGVFVPRRRTELLVRRAVELAPPRAVVVDLCCGSGAVGVALAALGDVAELHAADIDPAAVRCARRNLNAMTVRQAGSSDRGAPSAGGQRQAHARAAHQARQDRRRTRAAVHEGDLFDALPADLRGRVDVLAANVPYVPTGEIGLMPPEARLHEPRVALDGGADGLGVLRRVAAGAREWLSPSGHLFFETSERQAPIATETTTNHGLATSIVFDDDLGATVVVAQNPV